MQLGFVSAILPECNLEEVLQHAAQIGYDCVEVMCWPPGKAERRYAGVTHIDCSAIDAPSINEIHRLVDKYQVKISGLGYYPNALSPNPEEAQIAVEHIKKVILACAQLGLKNMNTFIGRDWKKSVEDNWPAFLATWPSIVQLAEEVDVKIGIENCPMAFTKDEWPGGKNLAHTPKIWKAIFDAIPSTHFGLNYDPSHMVWQHMDYLKPMRDFKHKLFHIHAKDVRIDYERLNEVGIMGHPNDFHTPKLPGLGEVNWGRFISILGDTGYRGPVCVEVEDRYFEGDLADRLASLQQSYNYLRQFIPQRA